MTETHGRKFMRFFFAVKVEQDYNEDRTHLG